MLSANNSSNKLHVVSAGGLECLINIVSLHCDEYELLQECLGAIRNLSTATENKQQMVENGVIQAVVQIMNKFPNAEIIQEQGAATLFNLADSGKADFRLFIPLKV